MDPSCCKFSPLISAFVLFLFLTSFVCPLQSVIFNNTKQNDSQKLEDIRAFLQKINKPPVKTIQSLDGDIIDCIQSHLQPAFDHPLLKGQKPIMDPPEMPKGSTSEKENFEEEFQVWRMFGESCPKNTVPIRRTTEEDVLRATSVRRFRRKTVRNEIGKHHEHAIGYVDGTLFGAEATINLWRPYIEHENEMSISQIWVLAGSIHNGDLNSIEAGWKVEHDDKYPKFFIYWTSDAYGKTGCYNLGCKGFVQTTKEVVLGSSIAPFSSYNGNQYDIKIQVWKDPSRGNWWLALNKINIGYWPSSLFPLLKDHATQVQFGGEIVNRGSYGHHTKTEMGSGHFPYESYGKASYIRGLQVIYSDNTLTPAPAKPYGLSEKPECYNAETHGHSKTWGTYIFYGGPGGKAATCR